jgi:hypothetical protein
MGFIVRFVKRMANHPKTLICAVLGTWLVAAALFSVLEGYGPLDSLYWSMTTMSTVGYGDLSAANWHGKVMTIVFQAWSIFVLVPCAVANIIDSVRVDEHKMTHDEQEWLFKNIETLVGQDCPPQPNDY